MNDRICEYCGLPFTPHGNAAKYCKLCKPNHPGALDAIMRCYLEHPGTFHDEIAPIEEIRRASDRRQQYLQTIPPDVVEPRTVELRRTRKQRKDVGWGLYQRIEKKKGNESVEHLEKEVRSMPCWCERINKRVDALLPACRFGYCDCFFGLDGKEPWPIEYCYECDECKEDR